MSQIRLPAICDDCTRVFPSGFAGGRNITVVGCSSGPCPHCGGMGSIPDGIYSTVENVLHVVSVEAAGTSQIQRLIAILRSSREENADSAAVAQHIRNDVPELAAVADALPRTRPELYAFIALIILILGFLCDRCSAGSEQTTISVDELIMNVYEDQGRSDASTDGE